MKTLAAALPLALLASLVPAAPAAASGFVAALPCSIGSLRKGRPSSALSFPLVTNTTSSTLLAGRQVTVVVTIAGQQQADDIVVPEGVTWPPGLQMESPNPVRNATSATCTAGLLPLPGPVYGNPGHYLPPTKPHPVLQ